MRSYNYTKIAVAHKGVPLKNLPFNRFNEIDFIVYDLISHTIIRKLHPAIALWCPLDIKMLIGGVGGIEFDSKSLK